MFIKKAAVLGAGVMGAQIAAHLVNAGIPTLLFDLPGPAPDKNSIVRKAIAQLKKLKPAPLALARLADDIEPANYEDDLHKLLTCDFIIEAVAERLDIKESLYQKISPFIKPTALLGSNTSGLSIDALARVLPEALCPQFCGVHFFNPPRYMSLVEITPHQHTTPEILDILETFLTTNLGKNVIRAKDTPSFVANRVAVFAILAMMHRALEMNIPFEVVDELTGKAFGRAKSALFRTIDVVGLDVLAHVIKTMDEQLPDDPWHQYYQMPTVLSDLIAQGTLGQKTGSGFYQKQGKNILVYDLATKNYRACSGQADRSVLALLAIKDPCERLRQLKNAPQTEARFLWLCLSDLFHYCGYHVADIAHNVRDLDLAMRWGFGWREGPFELWQLAGFSQVLTWVHDDIQSGAALVRVALPDWLHQVVVGGVYQTNAAYDPSSHTFVGRSSLPVYQRQLYFDAVVGETFNWGETWYEDAAVRFWTLDHQVGILSFKSKMNTIGDDVLNGILAVLAIAEAKASPIVIWQHNGANFSFGANLKQVMEEIYAKLGIEPVKAIVEKFQRVSQALRFSSVPVLAAVKGMALGGACEFIMHCDRVVAAMESYIGLVEVGVGLLPAGAGCKEFALRAYQQARGDDPYRDMVAYFKQMAMGEVSSSALDAKARDYLRASDVVVMHPNEILSVALIQAKAMMESGYHPPMPAHIPVVGKPGIANFQMMLTNMLKGEFISDYDFHIALNIATILCGGDIEVGSVVDEEWFLRLERTFFIELVENPKTQARIQYMLQNGKPLRN